MRPACRRKQHRQEEPPAGPEAWRHTEVDVPDGGFGGVFFELVELSWGSWMLLERLGRKGGLGVTTVEEASRVANADTLQLEYGTEDYDECS